MSSSIEDCDRMTQLVLCTGEENQRVKERGKRGVSSIRMEGDNTNFAVLVVSGQVRRGKHKCFAKAAIGDIVKPNGQGIA